MRIGNCDRWVLAHLTDAKKLIKLDNLWEGVKVVTRISLITRKRVIVVAL